MQTTGMATNSIILLMVLSISSLCSTRHVYIQPSEVMHCPGTPCYNINTFGKMADNFSNSSGLVVHFLEGTHLLDLQEVVVFMNLTNAVFEGDGRMEQGFHETVWQSTVVIKCTKHSSTGIAFVNSSNITFRYITITNCGADMTSLCRERFLCNGSLGFFRIGHTIALDHVSIQNGTSNGLLVYADGVDLIITYSSFAQNVAYDNNVSGGNIAIVYEDPIGCAHRRYVYNLLIINTNTSFEDSKLNKCAGIFINLFQGAYTIAIRLDSVIAYANKGFGIVLIVISEHDVPTYNLTVNNSIAFGANNMYSSGLSIVSSQTYFRQCPYPQKTLTESTIIIANSKFHSMYKDEIVSIYVLNAKFTTRIIIQSTEICHNICWLALKFNIISQYQALTYVTLENLIVNNNSRPYVYSGSHTTSGIYTKLVTALTLNNVSVTNNYMTGLTAYHTVVVVNGTSSIFCNNTGIDGGGLALYADSYLLFQAGYTVLNLINNSAIHRGGAIFVDARQESDPCFYQHYDNTPEVIVTGNKAKTAGTFLFGGTDIYECIFLRYIAHSEFNKTFNYSAQTGPSVISSEPTDVCFCDDSNTINCSRKQLTMTAYPGERINISVVTVGQLNGVSPGTLEIIPMDEQDGALFKSIPMNCTFIAFTPLDETYKLTVLDKESYKFLSISFSNCPLGFEKSNETVACDCIDLKKTVTTIICDIADKEITRHEDIWIGNISDCVIVQTPCPFDYCSTAQVSFSLTDPDPQCALNRTGILCGRCQLGLSLALGSNNCIQCPQFSYLALIIPFAAAGFGLVALLMVLNLTVSIGTINGLIFYASIVKISESTGIFFPNGPVPVLSQFIAWLNLDLGIETCFYPGMTAYAKVWLQFVFPLYIWFIIATIIVLCRYSTWLSNKIGGNVVQVLATLILLSFTKIFRTFAPALTWIELSCNGNSTTVWYVDGNVPYFSPEHYILMAAAVLFLLLAVPYVLALLFDIVIEKYLTRIMFFRRQWIKFKPFVDAYHGPYKDNCRFWTGLLLLVRMSFTLVSLHLDRFGTLIFITASTTILLSLLVTFEGVYQKKYLNMLECLAILNLGLLSALAAVFQNNTDKEQIVTIISVSIAFVSFAGILMFHALMRFSHAKIFTKLVNMMHFRSTSEENSRLIDDEDSMVNQLVEPTTSEVCLKRETLIY